jgi:acyl-coenzyme A thioesterase PaaI-like protein
VTVRSGTITAQDRVVRLTRVAVIVEGAVTNSQGEVCAQVVATFAVSYPEET